jgi:hypothetical protein
MPSAGAPAGLIEAMRYSVFAGGKRLRPMLVLAAAEAVAGRLGRSSPAGAGASRCPPRARSSSSTRTRWCTTTCRPWTTTRCGAAGPPPTSSTARGTRSSGDALLTEAFALLAREPATGMTAICPRRARLRSSTIGLEIAAAGAVGMVGGQAIDLGRRSVRPTRRATAAPPSPLDSAARHARAEDRRAHPRLAVAGAIMAGATARRRSRPTAGTRGHRSASPSRSSTTFSTSRARRRSRQDRRQGCRGRQADLPGPVRSRGVAPPRRGLHRSGARRPRRGAGSAASCRPSPAGSWPAHIEKGTAARYGPRRARPRGVARAGARPHPRGPGPGGRTARRQGRHGSAASAVLTVDAPDHPYVGRGGIKLAHALEQFGIAVEAGWPSTSAPRPAGSPTCCLRRGARSVVALDVGHGQLDWKLRTDPRVTSSSGVNAKNALA